MDKFSILIAHHQELFRALLVDFYNRQQDFQVIAATGDGEEAVQLGKTMKPDLIFLDPTLQTYSGIKATYFLKQAWPEAKIIILAASQDEDLVFQALKQGVFGFLDNTLSPAELLEYSRSALTGDDPLKPSLTVTLVKGSHQLSNLGKRSGRKRIQDTTEHQQLPCYG